MVAEEFSLGATIAFNVGINFAYYFARDSNGDEAMCLVRVIVGDIEEPTVQCPDDIVVSTDMGATAYEVGKNFAAVNLQYNFATYMDNVVPVGAADILDALPITMKLRSTNQFIGEGVTNFDIGTTVVEYKVQDGTGYTAMWAKCEVQIIVQDQEPPGEETGVRGDIGCPSDAVLPTVQETVLGQSYAEVDLFYADVIAVDNSGVVSSIQIRKAQGQVQDILDSVEPVAEGTHQFAVDLSRFGSPSQHTIEFSAIDPSGNVGDCTVTITVTDTQAPVLQCPPPLVDDGTGHPTDAGLNYYAVDIQGYDPAQVQGAVCTDNTGCGIIEVRYGAIDGPLLVEGGSSTTYNFMLDAGATQTHEVYFVAKDSPCEQCQTALGQNALGCSSFCSTTNIRDSALWDGGAVVGNTGHCVWTIMVKDTEAPVLTCPTTITASSVSGTDAAGFGADLQLGDDLPTDASTDPGQSEGFPYKTLTIRPASVVDNSNEPLVITATLEGGQAISTDTATTFPIGSTVVTYSATDNSGNVGICTTTVTVVDVEDPIMQCPSAQNLDTDPGQPYATLELPTPGSGADSGFMADNSGEVTYQTEIVSQPGIVPAGNPDNRFYYGDTEVVYTATDGYGRTRSCTLPIVVTDREDPVLTCPPDIVRSTDAADGSPASCTGAADGNGQPCQLNQDSTACAVETGDCAYTPDHVIVGYPHTVLAVVGSETVVVDNAVFGSIPSLVVRASIDGTEISVGSTSVDYEFPIGDTVVRYYATDSAAHTGNTNTGECYRTVTIEDNEDPAITCPADVVVPTTPYDSNSPVAGRDPENLSGAPNAVVTLVAATVRDNSEETLAVEGPTGEASFDIGVHSLTYTSSDSHGQTSQCTMTVTVEDDEAPILYCPADVTLDLLDNGLPYLELTVAANIGQAAVTDNNDLANVPVPVAAVTAPDNRPGVPDGTIVDITSITHRFYCCADSPTTVTFTALDGDLNVGTCTMTVTVVDVQNPVLTCTSLPTQYTFPDTMTEPSGLPYHRLVMAGPSIADNSGENLVAQAVIVQADRIEDSLDDTADGQGMLVTPVQITYDTQTEQYVHNFYIGTSTVRFTAIDSTGRSGSCQIQVTVIDNEPPVVVGSVVSGTTRHCIPERTVVRITGTCQDANGDTVDVQPLCEDIVVNDVASTWDNTAGTCETADGTTYSSRQACDLAAGHTWLTGHHSWKGLILRVPITDNSGASIAPVAYRGNPVSNVVIPVNTDNPTKIGPVELPISQLSSGEAVITFVATDSNANEESCELRVLVEDVEPPIITCPADAEVTTSGTSADVVIPDAVVTDNSETQVGEYLSVLQATASYYHAINDATVILPIGEPQTFSLDGTAEYTETIITYTSLDSAGNSVTCDWKLTVLDNEVPSVDCPLPKQVTTSAGRNFAEVTLERAGQSGGPSATDNSESVGEPFLNANDGLINTFARVQPSAQMCDGAPIASRLQDGCTIDNVVCDRDGMCSARITGIFEIGDHTVRYSAVDTAGNTGFCELQVLVEDNESPTLTCPSHLRGANYVTTDTNSPTKAIILDRLGGVGSSDVSDNSCWYSGSDGTCTDVFAIPSVIDPATGLRVNLVTAATMDESGRNTQPYQFPIGDFTEVRYTAVDPSGNTGYCVQRIEVRDEERPRLSCPTQNVYTTGSIGSTAYNGFARVTIAGPEDVDVQENSGQDLRASLNARFTRDWHPSLAAGILDQGSTQGLNEATVQNGNGVWAFPIGSTTVTYYVADTAGNEGTCSIQLQVLDNQPPRLSCPVIPDSNTNLNQAVATVEIMGTGSYPVSLTDNNPSDNSGFLVAHAEYNVGASTCENTANWFDSHLQNGCAAFDDPTYAGDYCSSDGCAAATADQATCEGAGACTFAAAVSATCTGAGQSASCTGAGQAATCDGTPTDSALNCDDPSACPAGCNYSPPIACALNGDSSDCADAAGGQCAYLPAIACTLNGDSTGCENLAGGQCTFAAGSTSSCSARFGSADGGTTDMAASAACCACGGGSTAGSAACAAGEYYKAGDCIAVVESPISIDFPIGENIVTFYATDSYDNTGSCNARVLVVDNQTPELICPSGLQFTSAFNQSFALVDVSDSAVFPTIPANDVSDNSGEDLASTVKPNIYDTATSSYVELSGPTQFQIGITVVHFTAVDAASNVGSCTMDVEVLDDEAPVLSCPDDVAVTTDADMPFSAVTLQNAIVFDNSRVHPPAVASIDPTSPVGRCTDGSTPAGDLCDDGSAVLTTINFPHNFMFGACPAEFPFHVSNDQNGWAGIVCFDNAADAAASSGLPGTWCLLEQFADESRASSLKAQVEDANNVAAYCDPASPRSATVVRFTATDDADNVGSCTMTVAVQDDQEPGVTCPAHQSVPTDVSSPTASVTFETATVVDNTGIVLYAVTDAQEGAFPIGASVLTYSATDASGNVGQCQIDVLVRDDESPVLVCPSDLTADSDSGQSFATMSLELPSVLDNSGETPTATAMRDNPTWVGSNGLGCAAFGDAGYATVHCSTLVDDSTGVAAAAACMACGGGEVINSSPTPTFELGETVVTYFATDSVRTATLIDGSSETTGNNRGSCSYTITILDNQVPGVVCPLSQVHFTDELLPFKSVTLTAATVTDNSDAVLAADATVNGVLVGPQQLTGLPRPEFRYDGASFGSAGTIVLCADFASRPGATNQLQCEAWCGASACGCTYDAGTDQCTGFPAAVYEVVYSATDAEDNTGSCTMQVTIVDNQIPRLTCPGPQTVATALATTIARVELQPAVVVDNSGETLVATAALDDGTALIIGPGADPATPPNDFAWTGTAPRGVVYIDVTYSATDSSGNIGSCTITITVPERDDCSVQPCVHGACTDQIGQYECTCDPGWSGQDCDVDIDECATLSPCKDPGTVRCEDSTTVKPDGDGSELMGCPPQTGDEYDYNSDYADCIPVDTYRCTCQPRYSGFDCEFLDECSFDPCHRPLAVDENYGRLIDPDLLDSFFTTEGPGVGSVADPTRFFCDASEIVESFNGESFDRFLCVDPDKTVTGDFYCRCPTCQETIFASADADALTTYFTAHPSMQLHILGEVRKEQQTQGECVDPSITREGCMDPLATNYDSLANTPCGDPPGPTASPATCVSTDPVNVDAGCALAVLDSDLSNSENSAACTAAATAGGGCTYTPGGCPCREARSGCMLPAATNYDATATVDPLNACRIQSTPTNECDANPCENVYFFETNAARGTTRVGSTDGVCEEPWVCTDPNEYMLNDYRCTCPQAVCGLDNVFPGVTNFNLSIFLHRENTLKAHLLRKIARATTLGGCDCMASWIVDDADCAVADGTGDPVCYETATPSDPADAEACAQVADLTTGVECGAVLRADGSGSAACTYGAAYNGCGMEPPCDGRDGGVAGNSYCEVIDPAACSPDPVLGGQHDFCTPDSGSGRRLLAELTATLGNSTAPSVNGSAL